MAKLERDLTDVKISTPSQSDPDAAKFKYLDDKYTEAATKCYNMKLEVGADIHREVTVKI